MNGPFRLDTSGLKALIFDVDGTLYRQGPLRRAMLRKLIAAHIHRPIAGLTAARIIAAYRRAQEEIRREGGMYDDLAAMQIQFASERTGATRITVEACITRWIEREPLQAIARYREEGLTELLDECKRRSLRLGVFSDYPAENKLRSLEIADRFDVTLCAQDPDVGAFKPNPKGICAVIERLGIEKRQALYVGDRPDVDAVAAKSAGVACAIISRRGSGQGGSGFYEFSSYRRLTEILFRQGSPRMDATS